MYVIGLTGGIASGKSTVSKLLKDKGAVIIDADEISRQIMMPGQPAYHEVIKKFGTKILKDKDDIDRKKLGDIVFSNTTLLKTLNQITHPAIVDEIKKRLDYYRSRSEKVAVIDAALLLEVGLNLLVDEVWLVVVDEKTQIKRLMEREKILTPKEAIKRIKAQMPLEEKRRLADKIIDNSGDLGYTKKQVDKLWREII